MARITRWISIIERCALLYRMQSFEELGLNGSQHMYIYYLCNHQEGIMQDALAKKVYINKSNAARNIKALLDKGFVKREKDSKDLRVYKIYPTAKAFAVLPKIKEKMGIFNLEITKQMSEEEVIALESALKKVALNASSYIEEYYEE